MINWPDLLVKDIARRRSVIYLGAGVSRNSMNDVGDHPKTWKEFLISAANDPKLDEAQRDLLTQKVNIQDYLLACELLRDFLGRDNYNNLLKHEFQQKRFNAAQIHKAISKLDSRIVISANFDQIYENYARQETKGAVSVLNYYDDDLASHIRNADDIILKLHGTIDNPNRMIFSQSDYAKARNMCPGFYQILTALITTHSFLFLGSGLNDPDIRLLLENYAFQYQWSRKHYFVIPKDQLTDSERKVYSESLNVDFLLYDSHDNHSELTESLFELDSQVDALREEISKTHQW